MRKRELNEAPNGYCFPKGATIWIDDESRIRTDQQNVQVADSIRGYELIDLMVKTHTNIKLEITE